MIVVGARCAGATVAIELARAGKRVLMVDRDEFGSDTLSTHGLWPNTLARLDELGVLERLNERHELNYVDFSFRAFDHHFTGAWSEIGGYTQAMAPRRVALDRAIAELAIEAGVEARYESTVRGLIGSGTAADPVVGIVMADGEEIEAEWVIGADGRASTVAGALDLPKSRELRGEMALLYAYWTGLPRNGLMSMHAERHGVLSWGTCEDGVQLVILNGAPEIARGGEEARTASYLEGIRRFSPTLEPEWLEDAERISAVRAAPESMLRGFYRSCAGPGWALAGDACHFKHPASAQGIADAIEHGIYVGRGIAGADPELEGYEDWRDARGAEHYEWSFEFARFPSDAADAVWGAVAADPEAAQDFRDTLSRKVLPRSEFLTPDRLGRWFRGRLKARRG